MAEHGRSTGSSAASLDPRALRSREQIEAAAVALISAGTPDPSVTDVANAAGVSRRAVYLNYGTLEQVLLAAVVRLLRTEFPAEQVVAERLPRSSPDTPPLLRRLARHLAAHRRFYATVLTGPSAHLVRTHIRETFGSDLRPILTDSGLPADDVAVGFIVHGMIGVLTEALSDPSSEPERVVDELWTVARLERRAGS